MELLKERSVSHPSRVLATTVTDRQVRVQVIGWPWWKSNADTSRDHAIELVFSGVSDGVLEPLDFDNEFDEALDWVEAFFGFLNGERTALDVQLDGNPWPEGNLIVERWGFQPSGGYQSGRYFFVALNP